MATKLPRTGWVIGWALVWVATLFLFVFPLSAAKDKQKIPIVVQNQANQTISQYPVLLLLPASPPVSTTLWLPSDWGLELLPDGDFERLPATWQEGGEEECLSRLGDWYQITAVPAYQSQQHFWAGGGCRVAGVVRPMSNYIEQAVYVSPAGSTLYFHYLPLRVDPDSETPDDYGFLQVNGVEVWRLDLTSENDSHNAWKWAAVDLSAYAGQTVTLRLGGVNGELFGLGNIFFDLIGFGATAVSLANVTGGEISYTDPSGDLTHVTIPPTAVSQPTTFVLSAHTLLAQDQPLPAGLGSATHQFDLSVRWHQVYLPMVMGSGAETAVSQPALLSPPMLPVTYPFAVPVTLTLRYGNEDVVGLDETSLRLYYWAGNQWVNAQTTCPTAIYPIHNPAGNSLQLPICHTGRFALVANKLP